MVFSWRCRACVKYWRFSGGRGVAASVLLSFQHSTELQPRFFSITFAYCRRAARKLRQLKSLAFQLVTALDAEPCSKVRVEPLYQSGLGRSGEIGVLLLNRTP